MAAWRNGGRVAGGSISGQVLDRIGAAFVNVCKSRLVLAALLGSGEIHL